MNKIFEVREHFVKCLVRIASSYSCQPRYAVDNNIIIAILKFKLIGKKITIFLFLFRFLFYYKRYAENTP